MPQLRLALAQVNATVGDLAGNAAAGPRAGRRGPRAGGAHLVAFPEMVLTGYPVEDLALRALVRRRVARPRCTQLAADLAADGLGDLPVVVGYLDQPRDATPAPTASAARTAAPASQGHAAELRGGPARGPGRRPLRQAPPAQLRRLRRVPHLRPGPRPDRRPGAAASTSPSPSARTSGRTAARWPRPARPAPSCCWCINGSPYERGQGRHPAGALPPVGPREAGCTLAYLNLVGGQDELVFDGDSLVVDVGRHGAGPRPAVPEDLLVVDLDLAERTVDPAAPARGRRARHRLATEPIAPYAAASPPRTRHGWTRSVRSTSALVPGPARLRPQERLPRRCVLGLSGGIDSALVATIAADALGGENVVGVSMPEPLLQRALPRRRRGARRAARRRLPGHPDRADGRARSWTSVGCHRRRRGEPPGPRARR